jgi:hypothetical protein
MSSTTTRSFARFTDLISCAFPKLGLQVECRSRQERLTAATATIGGRFPTGIGTRSVNPLVLALQNISTETQARSRLAVLRPGSVGQSRVTDQWSHQDRAHRSSPRAISIFGGPTGKPGAGMLALPCFPCPAPRPFFALDTGVNAKQEGSP